jgi:hypothetical protein
MIDNIEALEGAAYRLRLERETLLARAEKAETDRAAAIKRAEAAEAALLRWDAQAIGDALGLPIGADVPDRAVGAIKSLRERAEKAEADAARHSQDAMIAYMQRDEARAEAARLKGLLDAYKRGPWVVTAQGVNHPAGDVVKPPEPYTPRVGDVVLFDGERADSAEELPRVVTSVEPDGWWSCVHINRRGDVAAGPFRLNSRINCAVRLHRLATPAERAAAGLPAEAPAAPRVLKEHLAYLEAHAAWWSDGSGKATDAQEAARALVAAVARRDGGGK